VCNQTWDAHALVGQVAGIDPRGSFPALLAHEAEMLGRWDIVDALEGKAERRTPPPRKSEPLPEPEPERELPPVEELAALLNACTSTDADAEVASWLRSRSLDPLEIDRRGLAYALPRNAALPSWACYQRKTWIDLGHRLIVPIVDCTGEVRSVRAGRVIDGDSPKRLPPARHLCRGLVMADAMAREVLRAGAWPEWSPFRPLILIAEGEPDWLSMATMFDTSRGQQCAMFGIFSGAWTAEIAARIPDDAHITICTDHDPAGDKYAAQIVESIGSRCALHRGRVE
jgi:hypothetical protein